MSFLETVIFTSPAHQQTKRLEHATSQPRGDVLGMFLLFRSMCCSLCRSMIFNSWRDELSLFMRSASPLYPPELTPTLLHVLRSIIRSKPDIVAQVVIYLRELIDMRIGTVRLLGHFFFRIRDVFVSCYYSQKDGRSRSIFSHTIFTDSCS